MDKELPRLIDGKHWPTEHVGVELAYQRTDQGQTMSHRNHPNGKINQHIIVQLHSEKYNVHPSRETELMMRLAYVGNIEFLLPEITTRSSWNIFNPGQSDSAKEKYGYYPDPFTAITEVLKTKKGSRERRALILFMVNEGLVPCKEKCLYALIEQASTNDVSILRNSKWKKKYSTSMTSKQKVTVSASLVHPSHLDVGNIYFKLPLNGKVYTKREALSWIAKTKKGSKERGAMIRFMVEEGFVLCQEKCLYDLIRRVEVQHLPVGSDKWEKRGRPNNETVAYKHVASEILVPHPHPLNSDGTTRIQITPYRFATTLNCKSRKEQSIRYDDCIFRKGSKSKFELKDISELARDEFVENGNNEPAIRKNVLSRKGWKDHLILKMIPMKFRDDLENLSNPNYTSKHQIDLDVCSFIGYCLDYPRLTRTDALLLPSFVEDESLDRTYRLYFPPKDFGPPIDLLDGGNSEEFLKLKKHIRTRSRVFCNGGKDERVFTCISNYKRHENQPSCPFGFAVRWDRYGFFIHLLSHHRRYTNRGCPWHCCT